MSGNNRIFARLSLAMLLIITAGLVCGFVPVKAAGVTAYSSSQSSYDINDDGKTDTISVAQPGSSNNYSGRLYINGKKLFEFPSKTYGLGCRYRIITLKNGKRFILLSAVGANPGISDDVLLQYTKNGKIKKIISFRSALGIFGGAGFISDNSSTSGSDRAVQVSGNTVTIYYSKMLWTTGAVPLKFKFTYKNGTLKRTSYKGDVVRMKGYITSKNLQTYKKTNKNTKSVLFKKNTTVYVNKYYLKGSKMWLQLSDSSGRSGWIKCLTKNPGGSGSPYFSNGFYAS